MFLFNSFFGDFPLDYSDPVVQQGIVLPPFSHQRVFRFFSSGGALTIRKRIKKKAQLLKYLIRLQPKAVYFGVSRWINPTTVRQKPKNLNKMGFKWADNLFLSSDFVMDFDNQPPEMIKKAMGFVLTETNFEDFDQVLTKRGGQIRIYDWYQKYIPKNKLHDNPHDNENTAFFYKKKFLLELKKKGIQIDEHVALDTRRIVRLTGSIYNCKDGSQLLCKKLYLSPSLSGVASEPEIVLEDHPRQ